MNYKEQLERLVAENRLRVIPPHRKDSPLLNLTLNDYLGLGLRQREFGDEFRSRFPDVSMTASASRLLASDQEVFFKLEEYLQTCYGKPALLFNSGYHANVGIVSALNIPGTLWATDKLIHASVIDGVRMAQAENLRWRHNDVVHLRKLLQRNHDNHDRIIVVCESVYSMDGDLAPLEQLVALKREFPKMMLYVDEAHALGCFGPEGLGVCKDLGITDDIDILVGTFGKALASSGAFAVTSPVLHDFLVNSARSLIFSTAIPPANAAWTLLMLEKVAAMDAERIHLAQISTRFREGIESLTGAAISSRSAIVPLLTGDATTALSLSRELEANGILALPIRRPTVPPGGERIRFSLHAGLTHEDITQVLDTLSSLTPKLTIYR